jgi:hypothetical protein
MKGPYINNKNMANLKRIVSILFHLLGPFFTRVLALQVPKEKKALPIG